MKKTLAFFLAVCTLFALTACGAPEAPTAEPIYIPAASEAPAENPVDAVSTAPAEESEEAECPAEPVVSVSVYTEREYEYTEMDFCLMSYVCACPSVSVAGRESAERAIQASIEEKNTQLRDGMGEELLTMARENYELRMEEGVPLEEWYGGYAMERSVQEIWSGAELLSLELADYSFSNGAHGYTAFSGWNYDLTTGAELALSDLSEREDFTDFCLRRVTELSCDSALYDPAMFFEEYEEYLDDVVSDGLWYCTEEGLTFLANAYLLAPYAAGCLRFTIDWAELTEWLKPEYRYEPTASGSALPGALAEELSGCTFAVDDGTNGQGQPIVFTAGEELRRVSLRHLDYWEYADTFENRDVLFYVSRLGAGESVGVAAWVPDVLPNLGIFTGKTGRTIFQSGKDGSLLLEAIG